LLPPVNVFRLRRCFIGDVLLLQTNRESETADEYYSGRSSRLPPADASVSTFLLSRIVYILSFIIIIIIAGEKPT